VQQLHHLLRGQLRQRLAALFQRLVEANGHVLHLLVRLLGAADQDKVFGARQALVAVLVVQPDADKSQHLFDAPF